MSKPNLPPLVGRSPDEFAFSSELVTVDEAKSYAEEAVRQALAELVPVGCCMATANGHLHTFSSMRAADEVEQRARNLKQKIFHLYIIPETMEEIHRLERERSPWRLPQDPTLDMLEALRTGSRKDWPSDELCRVRYAALRSATLSAPPETRDG